MKNLLLVLFSILFLALGILFLIQDENKPSISNLTKKIAEDLIQAHRQNFFPPPINSLSQIQIATHTKNTLWKQEILKSISLPFDKISSGKYSLQIDAIESFTPEAEAILILQFNLFDDATKNKLWESSRIYHLDKIDLAEFKKYPKN